MLSEENINQQQDMDGEKLNLNEMIAKIEFLAVLCKENDYDVITPFVVGASKEIVERLIELSKSENILWITPTVSTEGNGDVSLEWWANGKVLVIFIKDKIEYLQVFGPNIFDEMEDGEIEDDEALLRLWKWLNNLT